MIWNGASNIYNNIMIAHIYQENLKATGLIKKGRKFYIVRFYDDLTYRLTQKNTLNIIV